MGFFDKKRPKSAINRDRAYKSQEPHEKNYMRKVSPKNPHYSKFEGGGVEFKNGSTVEGSEWIDEGVVPAKVYKSKTQVLELIRRLLKENGETILDGRKISELSEKDLFDIGYNHFEIHSVNDKYAKGSTIKGKKTFASLYPQIVNAVMLNA